MRLSIKPALSVLGFFFILFSVSVSPALAKPISEDKIPTSLLPWVDWVKYEHPELDCPVNYANPERSCIWPGELQIRANDTGAKFQQNLSVYRDTEVQLPGDKNNWPLSVTVNNQPLVVVERQGVPYAFFKAGEYKVLGEFLWNTLPASLKIAPQTGIVRYTLNNKVVRLPQIRQASLWLRGSETKQTTQAPQDKLNMQVFRLVEDGHPVKMTTYIQLEVSGKQRELVLGKPLLKDFIPVNIESALPARLENNGGLRVQVRPGRWVFQVHSRHPSNVTDLPYEYGGVADEGVANSVLVNGNSANAAVTKAWPESEVWVYRTSPKDRQTEIESVRQIDPRQVQLPNIWANLPAYEVKAGSDFKIKVNLRGDPLPEPDSLNLTRDYWLDFSGQGLTVRDQVVGKMTSGWRLSADNAFDLGRVTVNGQPQFITRLAGEDGNGVEVRRGQLNMTAESRFEGDLMAIPATGWGRDFQKVSSQLHLPPGYQLMAVSGVDNVPASWLQRWTLYDIFLVLIISLGVAKLWGWKWLPLAMLTTALIWHEVNAPKMIWLFLLAVIALLRVVPLENRFYQYLKTFRVIGLVILVIIILPFIVQQAREAIYPQLEKHWINPVPLSMLHTQVDGVNGQVMNDYENNEAVYSSNTESIVKGRAAELASSMAEPAKRALEKTVPYRQSQTLNQIDPAATIQTGPGLPQWNWRTVQLSWNGPVAAQQTISLYLLGPLGSMLLSFLSIALILLLAWRFLDLKLKKEHTNLKVLLAGLVALFSVNSNAAELSSPSPAQFSAQFPTQALLQQLEQRLIVPSTDAPRAAISVLNFDYEKDQYSVTFTAQTLENTAIPLPVDMGSSTPVKVLLNDKSVNNQLYRKQNQLWLLVPKGQHKVMLSVYLPNVNQVQIPLPLKPFKVIANGEAWSLEGVDENGQPQQQLSLTRLPDTNANNANKIDSSKVNNDADDQLSPSVLPPFLRVERTLQFGLQWQVVTRVIRVSPLGTPVTVQVPIIDGASVVTEGLKVAEGKVLVNMSANQRQVSWRSRLDSVETLTLTASDNANWLEVWRADIGSMWHVEIDGIAPIHHQDSGQTWLPAWHPWPGEKVSFTVQRPVGVEGATATIDNSLLTVKPGKRATDSTLNFRLRSSQGGKRNITLPNGAELLSVKVNGRTQPIRLEGNTVTLPVVPGQQNYEINWRTNQGIGDGFDVQWQTPQVSLGGESVNASIKVMMPRDRWSLWLAGPSLGPAVLFWGVLIILVLLAVVLGRVGAGHLPIGMTTWLVLGLGLSQVSVFALVLVAVWFFVMYLRMQTVENPNFTKPWFNLLQIILVMLSVVTAIVLLGAVQNGLLGQPAMLIQGNQSTSYLFNWYQDRIGSAYPQAEVISAPLWVYRTLMLVWALWLAFSLLAWIKWGWQAFSAGGLWRKVSIILPKPKFKNKAQAAAEPEPEQKAEVDPWTGEAKKASTNDTPTNDSLESATEPTNKS
ncbi:MAG: hypothetical protein U9N57_10710 [Pseudomonadota bacterium]|nr:hypothetical protein [Pseudomonadota bacterium]